MNTAIGQGFIQTTPLQIALMTSALVHPQNVMYQPRLLRKVINSDSQINFDSRRALTKLPFSKKNVELIKEWMSQVVLKGTGVNANIPEIAIAGKTGTAEDPPRPNPHAWFTSYAPAENPQIVVTVFVQGGGHGGVKAAAISRELIKTWNAKRRAKS
jgi:cell division protein FtsI/penicillin-binding protein 2